MEDGSWLLMLIGSVGKKCRLKVEDWGGRADTYRGRARSAITTSSFCVQLSTLALAARSHRVRFDLRTSKSVRHAG